jgi:hypothetical protein
MLLFVIAIWLFHIKGELFDTNISKNFPSALDKKQVIIGL